MRRRSLARACGLNWILAPDVRPGLPLTQSMRSVVAAETAVVVLANHGLVVCGDTVTAAAAMLDEVVARLKRPVRAAPEPDLTALTQLCAGYGYPFAPSAGGPHDCPPIARASTSRAPRIALPRSHRVSQGPACSALGAGETLADGLPRARREGRGEPALVLVPGKGALIRAAAPPAAEAIAGCLGDVLQRLSADEPIRVLTKEEEDAIANWDAEIYRKALARRPA